MPDIDLPVNVIGKALPEEARMMAIRLLREAGTAGLTVREAEEAGLPERSASNVLYRLGKADIATTVTEGSALRYFIKGMSPSTDPEGLLPVEDEEFTPDPMHTINEENR